MTTSIPSGDVNLRLRSRPFARKRRACARPQTARYRGHPEAAFRPANMCVRHPGAFIAPRDLVAAFQRCSFPCFRAAPREKAMDQGQRASKPHACACARKRVVVPLHSGSSAFNAASSIAQSWAARSHMPAPQAGDRAAMLNPTDGRQRSLSAPPGAPTLGAAQAPVETNGKGRPSQEGKWHTQRTRIHRWKPYGSSRQ